MKSILQDTHGKRYTYDKNYQQAQTKSIHTKRNHNNLTKHTKHNLSISEVNAIHVLSWVNKKKKPNSI